MDNTIFSNRHNLLIFLYGIHSLNSQDYIIYKKYFGNPYACTEMLLNKPKNTLNYMCDLDIFSKIQLHFKLIIYALLVNFS